MRLLRAIPLLSLAVLSALASGCGSAAAGAVVMTSLAGGVSAARRANGECYVDCRPGTHCNRETGLCDPLSCAGSCGAGFSCVETETGSACVPRDHAAELAARPQEPVSGAQPFGEGQAVNGPHVAVTAGNTGSTTLGAAPAAPLPPGAISTRRGAGGSDAGASESDGGTDAGLAAPPAALQVVPVRQKDAPANSTSNPPWLESNPWDPHHADPVPQMSNPNQPPPH